MTAEAGGLVLDHVAVSVPDLAAATDWYVEALGLTAGPAFAIPGTDLSGCMLRHEPSGYRLELLHRPGAAAGPDSTSPETATGTLGYGHLCLRTDDVAGQFARLVAAGAVVRRPPAPSPNRPGATVAFLTDPWDNLVELLDRPEEAPSVEPPA